MLLELHNGPVVRDAAIVLGCELEARGHRLTVQDGALHVSQGSALTTADIAAIKQYRAHLIACVDYCARGVV